MSDLALRVHNQVPFWSVIGGRIWAHYRMPPDNATGNFTKIVQRVPVKIVLDRQNPMGLLRPGMSAVPTIDTKATVKADRQSQRELAARATTPNGG